MVIEKFTYFLDFKKIQLQKSLHFNIELTSLLTWDLKEPSTGSGEYNSRAIVVHISRRYMQVKNLIFLNLLVWYD